MGKIIPAWAASFMFSFYTTFVMQRLWNWFAVPALGLPQISYWILYGLVLLVTVLFDRTAQEFTEEARWTVAMTAIEACIPPEKMNEVRRAMDHHTDDIWIKALIAAVGKFAGTTATLVVGWGVHAFLA